MNITFKSISMRNFLSYGNNITKINLNFVDPTLIIGKNYDSIVDGQVDSNGAGKTSVLHALLYCLYDKTTSGIEKNDLINYINQKNMEVEIEFSIGNVNYKIERFRKNKSKGGDGVKIYINDAGDTFDETNDKTPDSIANANKKIEEILGIPYEIFSRIVVFTAKNEPFLSLPFSHASKVNQRDIIEELFGLTELSRKAEILKSIISDTKSRISSLKIINDRIIGEHERLSNQLLSYTSKKDDWEETKKNSIIEIKSLLKQYSKIDIKHIKSLLDEKSLLTETMSSIVEAKRTLQRERDQIIHENSRLIEWDDDHKRKLEQIISEIGELTKIDIPYCKSIKLQLDEYKSNLAVESSEYKKLKVAKERLSFEYQKIIMEIESLEDSTCPYCKQEYLESKNKLNACKEALTVKSNEIKETANLLETSEENILKIESKIKELSIIDIPKNINTIEETYNNLISKKSVLESNVNPFKFIDTEKVDVEIKTLTSKIDMIQSQINEVSNKLISDNTGEPWTPTTINKIEYYLETNVDKLDELKRESNPFVDMISEINDHIKTLSEEDHTKEIDDLSESLKHQEFLLKLLTKKDSFLRKALLNKNLPFLNSRLNHYLKIIGLSHTVHFREDMSVNISQFSTEYSFNNLSSGQQARINLALAFAFRDVLQARFSSINLCVLDECLDIGLGNVGVQLATKMIKQIAKDDKLSMFVISHRDEISTMFNDKLEIELKNGFSNVI